MLIHSRLSYHSVSIFTKIQQLDFDTNMGCFYWIRQGWLSAWREIKVRVENHLNAYWRWMYSERLLRLTFVEECNMLTNVDHAFHACLKLRQRMIKVHSLNIIPYHTLKKLVQETCAKFFGVKVWCKFTRALVQVSSFLTAHQHIKGHSVPELLFKLAQDTAAFYSI